MRRPAQEAAKQQNQNHVGMILINKTKNRKSPERKCC